MLRSFHVESPTPLARRAVLAAIVALVTAAPSFAIATQDCSRTSLGQFPLDDLAGASYLGFEGGLYPGATNAIPADHLRAGRTIAERLEPLGPDGQPAADGIVGFAAIGFSFTHQVFEVFQQLAQDDAEMAPRLVAIDATWRGRNLEDLRDPANDYWTEGVPQRLAEAGVTAAQIQVVWIMEGEREMPAAFPDHVDLIADDWTALLHNLLADLPNVKLAYLTPVHWQGYAWFAPDEEPSYFEQGFAVREVIARQLAGAPELQWDPELGPCVAPWIAWGPYFWSDGSEPRSDGLHLDCDDYSWDGSHLDVSGQQVLGARLRHFVKADPACTRWSVVAGAAPAGRIADVERLTGASSDLAAPPRLVAIAPPTIPYPGDFALEVRGAQPDGDGVIVLSDRRFTGDGVAFGSGRLLVVPDLVLALPFGPDGNALVGLGEIPDDPALAQLEWYAQLVAFEAGATGGVALSDAIELLPGD